MLFHVTGARGLVGQEIMKALAKVGEVHGTDVDDMDVTRLDDVRAVFSQRPPDAIVHLAGLKGNLPSRQRPLDFFGVNTTGTLNVLEAGRQASARQFVFFSSLTVHGPVQEPVSETSPLNPLHPYSGSKAAAEYIVHAYANAYGMRCAIFRPNFIVGPINPPQPYFDNLVYDFIQDIYNKGVIELAGDGTFQREWMHPSDVAEAVKLALTTPATGCDTYILCGERVTMTELASRIIKQVGKGSISTNPSRTGFSITSTSDKARRDLGWSPQVSLDALITQIWDEYRARHG